MSGHAFLSPSGAPAWLRCHAKVWREKGLPDDSSEFADEGIAAHFLRDVCLTDGFDTKHFLGRWIAVTPIGGTWMTTAGHSAAPNFQADADMCREVQKSIDVIRSLTKGGQLHPEQKLSISFITGEEDATGTADTVIEQPKELIVDDLKYGMGVPVYAEDNEQLLIYGAAALEEFDVLGEIEELTMRISQPRINNDSEWTLPVAEVRRRIIDIRAVADKIMAGPEGLEATPGEKQCRWCKVKATCEENRNFILGTVADDFVDLNKGEMAVSAQDAERIIAQAYGVKPGAVSVTGSAIVCKPSILPQLEAAEERIVASDDQHLATCMDALDMIESWCKSVRAETERRLLLGEFSDARYKLVEGKRGSRSWIDVAEAEAAMKAMRLKVDQMYDLKVISPTSAEKLLAADNPRKWKKLQDQITQTQGKPSVAPASDKRPAMNLTIKFEALPEETEGLI
ncbi:DUF2800 domain-containing protein [Herbaspirillum sp. RTI4]|uniref:DUF2800 domain-containing protein n=1 Tax=Herbaspirillum sp. RTI4 TaxID=3048640 RepID=UPI002AB36CA5|nr:DUF2800 domain-containing protein [Herbaspirillum sp. RTI4]MDY7579377.1 DUF2800 domain-containing protein [Herbaspirillum sp. RTI4]MEA9980291.1 DUF2800 domain-containing protein [Herbaspirillum sp. RTI4]